MRSTTSAPVLSGTRGSGNRVRLRLMCHLTAPRDVSHVDAACVRSEVPRARLLRIGRTCARGLEQLVPHPELEGSAFHQDVARGTAAVLATLTYCQPPQTVPFAETWRVTL